MQAECISTLAGPKRFKEVTFRVLCTYICEERLHTLYDVVLLERAMLVGIRLPSRKSVV